MSTWESICGCGRASLGFCWVHPIRPEAATAHTADRSTCWAEGPLSSQGLGLGKVMPGRTPFTCEHRAALTVESGTTPTRATHPAGKGRKGHKLSWSPMQSGSKAHRLGAEPLRFLRAPLRHLLLLLRLEVGAVDKASAASTGHRGIQGWAGHCCFHRPWHGQHLPLGRTVCRTCDPLNQHRKCQG